MTNRNEDEFREIKNELGELRREVKSLTAQSDRFNRAIAQLSNVKEETVNAVIEQIVYLRQQVHESLKATYLNVGSLHDEVKEVDEKRAYGQKRAERFRIAILILLVIAIVMLGYLIGLLHGNR